ncbi:uncharacterized protein VP01_1947g3 [Puccinia sorghi]|uniref:Uncharacterized protein n=1 Tax=Puccinia sorghi TaxID=27349 RepID=A0A0L6VCR7_9BASI|nr:uncharacterized protein VP01_1947g3 [Puccinia sorghi]
MDIMVNLFLPCCPLPPHVSKICIARPSPRRQYNFRVELMPGAVPQASRIMLLSPAENEVLALQK